MSKYKVIGFQYELCHRFQLGDIVESTGVEDKGAAGIWYKDKDGLEQILVDSEVEVLEN